ncbi:hypothetical protein BH09SUM1_BH09SUM1_17570 [soil metagenome]
MRLSEPRLRALSKKMAREMSSKGVVRVPSGETGIADLLAKVLTLDQQKEIDIEEEARALVSKQRNLPPPGSGEYQAAFQQAKRAIAVRKGFHL